MIVRTRNNTPSPFVEELESRLLMAASPIANLMASASNLYIGPTDTMTVSDTVNAGDPQLYRFTAAAKGKMTLNTTALTGQYNSKMAIYNAAGRLIRTVNGNKKNPNSAMTVNVAAGSDYYVLITGNWNTTGDYQLQLRSIATDDFGNASSVAKGVKLNGRGQATVNGLVNYSSDVDVFGVVATKTGTLTLEMTPLDRKVPLDCVVTATDALGATLGSAGQKDGSNNATITIDVTAGQAYYFQAGGDNGSIGRYRVRASLIATPPAAPPTNNTNPTVQPTCEYTAGDTIQTQLKQLGNGVQLVVLGTNQNDVITLSQTSEGVTVTTSTTSWNVDGLFASIVMYGFDGSDTLRLTNTVTAGAMISGGAGNDTIYDAGAGNDTLYGDDGNDLLVSVGGGNDLIYGGNGFDSFWGDAGDAVKDASSAETSAQTVHLISSFYQPFTQDQNNPQYVPMTIAGQSLDDPAASGTYANFASTPLFVDGPQHNDVAQGQIGDCYFLATLASMADTKTETVRQMITSLGDGTYAVRFYTAGQAVYLRLDADLPVSYGNSLIYARLGADGELWVPLLEKAYAFFRYGSNSYASLNGGWMSTVYGQIAAMPTLSGSLTSYSASSLYNRLQADLASGKSITLGSNAGITGPIVGSHAYMLKSVSYTAGQYMMTVFNPWGFDGRTTGDSNSNDGLVTITMDQAITYFSSFVETAA